MGLLGISCRAVLARFKASRRIVQETRKYIRTALTASVLIFGSSFLPAHADPSRVDSPVINGQRFTNVYRWNDETCQPRAVVVAIHGLTMHGTVFETLARHLASEGILVYAPDLRGYGEWQTDAGREEAARGKDNHTKVAYQESCSDLLELVKATRAQHPDLPLYCIGESLGADLAMEVTGKMPDAVSGLIVSSPAIKRKLHVEQMAYALGKVLTAPHMTLDVTPYIRYFASEDPRVGNEAANDPLVRKKLSVKDLLQTFKYVDSGLKFAETVPNKTPVLVLQGDKDTIIDSRGVLKLAQRLSSNDQTIKWLKGKGHLLLETSFICDNAMTAVDQWLDRQTGHADEQLPLAVSLHKSLAFPLADQLASD